MPDYSTEPRDRQVLASLDTRLLAVEVLVRQTAIRTQRTDRRAAGHTRRQFGIFAVCSLILGTQIIASLQRLSALNATQLGYMLVADVVIWLAVILFVFLHADDPPLFRHGAQRTGPPDGAGYGG